MVFPGESFPEICLKFLNFLRANPSKILGNSEQSGESCSARRWKFLQIQIRIFSVWKGKRPKMKGSKINLRDSSLIEEFRKLPERCKDTVYVWTAYHITELIYFKHCYFNLGRPRSSGWIRTGRVQWFAGKFFFSFSSFVFFLTWTSANLKMSENFVDFYFVALPRGCT